MLWTQFHLRHIDRKGNNYLKNVPIYLAIPNETLFKMNTNKYGFEALLYIYRNYVLVKNVT